MGSCPKKDGFYGLTNKTRIFLQSSWKMSEASNSLLDGENAGCLLLQDLLGWSTSSILHRPNPTEISTRDYTTSISLKAYENAIQIPLKHYYAHILIPWNSHENPTISSHPSSHWPPRKGQLLAAFSARRTGPPLSDEKIIKVLFHMPSGIYRRAMVPMVPVVTCG